MWFGVQNAKLSAQISTCGQVPLIQECCRQPLAKTDLLHAVNEESPLELVHVALREGGVLATLWTGEWLVQASPEGQAEDALLAVVVAARQHLRLGVVTMTDRTCYLFLKFLNAFLHNTSSHSPRSTRFSWHNAQARACVLFGGQFKAVTLA